MATDSWAQAVDEQEAAAESIGNLQIKEKPEENGTLSNATDSGSAAAKSEPEGENKTTEDDDKDDKAAQSLLNKLIRNNLVNNTNQVEVLQKDPNSPLYSVKSFEELRLKPQLLQGVYGMGFNRPSKIQETALPMMLAGPPQNLIAQSQSGTGKTAAFVLAMLSHVDPDNKYPQCLCVSPTYELALQTGKVIEQMGKHYPEVKLVYAIRGNKLPRGMKLQEQIVIGTPGTMLDWCSKFKFIDPKKIKVFVLDEADVMIATQGHQDQSIRIQRMLPQTCQMLLFSATFEETVWNFAQRIVPSPNIIKLKREEETLDTIKQYYVLCNSREEKFQALCNVYGAITIAQAMIFCHTRKTAGWLAGELSREGHQVALLSGEMQVEQRAAVIDRFRDGKEKVLVTTNVCARGIDVEQVSVVINFDLPVDKDGNPDNETYLHRIGRTGRFGKRGLAINMVDGKMSMNILNRIQEHFSKKIERLDTDDLDEIEKIAS
ncbi:ATP-dependent RNA helicase DDX19B [Labrus bergylta]|uniref:ATP-dependent RNA helicase DDX19B n=1 Tax=Labrus bergylta TaxID=56723 RepID=UPI0009B48DB8|nr:ATP-dependent RNA helicase DDX19B [Labrus bergylta]XP_060898045.1 ATP-dependent RNA helicase DDX19B [Labrus mixtus]